MAARPHPLAVAGDPGSVAERVRAWLGEGEHRGISPYTLTRIEQSFGAVAARLAPCGDLDPGTAFDAGCGSAFDCFALADRLGAAYGVDVNRRAVREGRRIAARCGVREVRVERGTAEGLALSHPATLVWSNIMSHNTPSRVGLLRALIQAMKPGAWLVYAEECEGYPLLEIQRSAERRDAAAARARVRQALAGARGTPTVRFFASGTAGPIMERLGLEVLRTQVETTVQGGAIAERVWARRPAGGEIDPGGTALPDPAGDYVEPVPWLSEIPADPADATGPCQAAYAALPELVTALRMPDRASAGPAQRLLDHSPLRRRAIDWSRVDEIVGDWRPQPAAR